MGLIGRSAVRHRPTAAYRPQGPSGADDMARTVARCRGRPLARVRSLSLDCSFPIVREPPRGRGAPQPGAPERAVILARDPRTIDRGPPPCSPSVRRWGQARGDQGVVGCPRQDVRLRPHPAAPPGDAWHLREARLPCGSPPGASCTAFSFSLPSRPATFSPPTPRPPRSPTPRTPPPIQVRPTPPTRARKTPRTAGIRATPATWAPGGRVRRGPHRRGAAQGDLRSRLRHPQREHDLVQRAHRRQRVPGLGARL